MCMYFYKVVVVDDVVAIVVVVASVVLAVVVVDGGGAVAVVHAAAAAVVVVLVCMCYQLSYKQQKMQQYCIIINIRKSTYSRISMRRNTSSIGRNSSYNTSSIGRNSSYNTSSIGRNSSYNCSSSLTEGIKFAVCLIKVEVNVAEGELSAEIAAASIVV